MLKKLRKIVRDEGAINVSAMVIACLTMVGGLVSVIYANASQRITTLEGKSDSYIVEITSLKSDVRWIKDALEARGFSSPREKSSFRASSTVGVK